MQTLKDIIGLVDRERAPGSDSAGDTSDDVGDHEGGDGSDGPESGNDDNGHDASGGAGEVASEPVAPEGAEVADSQVSSPTELEFSSLELPSVDDLEPAVPTLPAAAGLTYRDSLMDQCETLPMPDLDDATEESAAPSAPASKKALPPVPSFPGNHPETKNAEQSLETENAMEQSLQTEVIKNVVEQSWEPVAEQPVKPPPASPPCMRKVYSSSEDSQNPLETSTPTSHDRVLAPDNCFRSS